MIRRSPAPLGSLGVAAAAMLLLSGPRLLTAQAQGPTLRITSPPPDTVVTMPIRLEVVIEPPADVTSMTFTMDGRMVGTAERPVPPFGCRWNPGEVITKHHLRVTASLANGRQLVATMWTKDLGYTDKARADAVLVPVIVTDHGKFVRGL